MQLLGESLHLHAIEKKIYIYILLVVQYSRDSLLPWVLGLTRKGE